MAKAKGFDVGDRVQLNSGGPVMSVKWVSENGRNYDCQWFAGKKLDKGNFVAEQLVRVPDEEEPK
jgi:uncharacterized protein YodC (DUF2158 family)